MVIVPHRRKHFGGSVVSTTNLVSFWKLDEASGTRSDAFGSNDLTDNNTVGQGTGTVYANCADFERSNTEYLSIADGSQSGLSPLPTDFTISFWVKLESNPSSTAFTIASQDDYGTGTSTDRSWNLSFNTTPQNRFIFYVFGGASFTANTANSFGAPSTGTWYHICAGYDSVSQETFITVNDGTKDTVSHTIGLNNSTAPVSIGGRFNNTAIDSGAVYDGLIEAFGFWGRVLSDAEITALANPNDPFYDQF